MQTANAKRKVFHTISSLARDWGVSRLTVERMVKSGRLHTVKLNRRRMIHVREVQRIEEGSRG